MLDFTLTLHGLHLVITTVYAREVPRNWLWWALQGASAGLMAAGGVWACRWRELKPIQFGGKAPPPAAAAVTRRGGGAEEEEEGGAGFEMGRGRGRGRDGGGEYEMVGIKEGRVGEG